MKNFFKNYFKGFGDSNYPFWKVMVIVLPMAILLTYGMSACKNTWAKNHPTKYDTYEILIIDKYEDIGSTWHFISGRASETEYHIVYKYCNRTKNTSWEDKTRTVNGTKYRKYNIGDRFKVKQTEDYIGAPYLP